MRPNVIIMSGISGSGKSTYARRRFPGADVVSADHYFMEDGGRYVFDRTKLGDAHAECFRRFIYLLERGDCPIVVDNTNLSVQEIAPYVLGARAFDCDVEIITFRADVETCLRNVHGLGEMALNKQLARLNSRHLPKEWKNEDIRVQE